MQGFRKIPLRILLLIVASLLIAALLTAALAQQRATITPIRSEAEPGFSEVVNELRQIRAALDRTLAFNRRFQWVFEQMRIQQERVDRFATQTDALRTQVGDTQEGQQQLTAYIQELENKLSVAADPAVRAELENSLKLARNNLEQTGKRLQEQSEKLNQSQGSLQNEQAKLAELKERLETLERTIEKKQPQ